MKYFFDTYAIIEIIKGKESYRPFLGQEIVTSILNLGELYYSLSRHFTKRTARIWIERLKKAAMSVNLEDLIEAMGFRIENKKRRLSFIDCTGYILARKNNLVFLTGDKGFRGLRGVEFVK